MWIHQPNPEQLAHPARCRGCDAEIHWVTTKAGANCPINADFKILSTQKFGVEELIEIRQEDSHFVTCPARDQFKRRRK